MSLTRERTKYWSDVPTWQKAVLSIHTSYEGILPQFL